MRGLSPSWGRGGIQEYSPPSYNYKKDNYKRNDWLKEEMRRSRIDSGKKERSEWDPGGDGGGTEVQISGVVLTGQQNIMTKKSWRYRIWWLWCPLRWYYSVHSDLSGSYLHRPLWLDIQPLHFVLFREDLTHERPVRPLWKLSRILLGMWMKLHFVWS